FCMCFTNVKACPFTGKGPSVFSEISTRGASAGIGAIADCASSEELTWVLVWATGVIDRVGAAAAVAVAPATGIGAVAPARAWGLGGAACFDACFEQAESATHTTAEASAVAPLRMPLV